MISIAVLEEDRLDGLEALWQALFEHHRSLTPHLRDQEVPFQQSWETRRGMEEGRLTSEPDSFVLTAEDETGALVGYAFVRVRSGAGLASSWSISDPVAWLATLVVLPEARGEGVGSALLDAVEARLAAAGFGDLIIGVITTNVDAIRLHEARGARPFVTELIQPIGGAGKPDPSIGPAG